jgi:orotidine-5'-phosphate decarboxylase
MVSDYALILANDKTNPQEALEVTEATAPFLNAVKIGITTTLDTGVSLFKELSKITDIDKIADYKVADIGFKKGDEWSGTNEKIVRTLTEAGADYVICHTIVGTSSIQESVETAHKLGGKVLTLPYMTHKGADLFFDQPVNMDLTIEKLEKDLGFPSAAKKLIELEKRKEKEKNWRLPYVSISDLILIIGEDVGVDGYIGPANIPDVLIDYRKLTQKPTYAPGVGRQKRAEDLTPEQQIKRVYEILGKNSGVIVGSAIYKTDDPAKSAEQFRNYRDNAVKSLQ